MIKAILRPWKAIINSWKIIIDIYIDFFKTEIILIDGKIYEGEILKELSRDDLILIALDDK